MKRRPQTSNGSLRRGLFLLSAVFQIGCGTIFLTDVIAEWHEMTPHTWLELVGVVALAFGAGTSLLEYWLLLQRNTKVERELDAATGAFQEALGEHFDAWGLTPAERDVALLSIKGASITEIAAMRDTREGTIKAQNAAIYRKAGVSSRSELIACVIEELIAGLKTDAAEPPLRLVSSKD